MEIKNEEKKSGYFDCLIKVSEKFYLIYFS